MTNRYIPVKLQELVKERAQGCCEYCICPESHATQNHSNEHVIPESQGGATTAENLALACQGCNNKKYNKTQAIDPVSGAVSQRLNCGSGLLTSTRDEVAAIEELGLQRQAQRPGL